MEKEILEIIEFAKSKIEEIEVLFVANVYGKTEEKDYLSVKDSIITEFFTETEYNGLIGAIKSSGFKTQTFFSEEEFIEFILKENIFNSQKYIVFNLARNGTGVNKKALIPSFCLSRGIMFTGSEAYTTGLGRHKFHYNSILSNLGLPVAKTYVYSQTGWLMNTSPKLDEQVIVKPMFESASRGVHQNGVFNFKNSQKQINYMDNLLKEFNQDIIVQEFLPGNEFEVPVIELDEFKALGAVKIEFDKLKSQKYNIIDFDIAFDEKYSFENFKDSNLNQIAEKAATILGFKTYSRIDFREDKDGNYKIIDVSTHPYIISHSSYLSLFEEKGFEYPDIFLFIIGKTIFSSHNSKINSKKASSK